jgi:dTDP-4-dehydrorhamnose 3,5-epimerase
VTGGARRIDASAIEGVTVVPLRVIADERGAVLQMLKESDAHFRRFGEIYFSSVNRGVVKGWKKHSRLVANYACVYGHIKLVLFDDRPGSATEGAVSEIFIGPAEDYRLVVIAPDIWHAFQGVSAPMALLANCATEPSDPDELERLDPTSDQIPYRW